MTSLAPTPAKDSGNTFELIDSDQVKKDVEAAFSEVAAMVRAAFQGCDCGWGSVRVDVVFVGAKGSQTGGLGFYVNDIFAKRSIRKKNAAGVEKDLQAEVEKELKPIAAALVAGLQKALDAAAGIASLFGGGGGGKGGYKTGDKRVLMRFGADCKSKDLKPCGPPDADAVRTVDAAASVTKTVSGVTGHLTVYFQMKFIGEWDYYTEVAPTKVASMAAPSPTMSHNQLARTCGGPGGPCGPDADNAAFLHGPVSVGHAIPATTQSPSQFAERLATMLYEARWNREMNGELEWAAPPISGAHDAP